MTTCPSPNDLASLIDQILNKVISEYLLCGVLQGGLQACGETAIVPRGTQIVLCRQLADLVQDGIDKGDIIAPTVVRIEGIGTEIVLTLADGDQLRLDLTEVVRKIGDDFFVDCNGKKVALGTAIATCNDLGNATHALEDALNAIDKNLQNQIDLWEQKLKAQSDNLTLYVDKKTAEWANTILLELIDLVKDIYIVNHDESLVGNGSLECLLGVNEDWLNEFIKNYMALYGSTVKHDDSLAGDGTTENPLEVNVDWLQEFLEQYFLDNPIKPIVIHDNTLTGNGTSDEPLGVDEDYLKDFVEQNTPDGIVIHDETLSGEGTAEKPLGVDEEYLKDFVEQNTPDGIVIHDDTLSGEGTAEKPLGVDEDYLKDFVVEHAPPPKIFDLVDPLGLAFVSQRGREMKAVMIIGYGFALDQTITDATATVAIKDKDADDIEVVIGHVWAAKNESKYIVVPLYNCDAEIIGYGCALPFLSKL